MVKADSPRSKRATLRDVAKEANVSMMTVSNVVNGNTARVGEDVRNRVQAAMQSLNYLPHLRGRSLKLAREFTIGLVVLHPESRFLNDPFNTEVAAGMSNRLARDGYGLMVFGAQGVKEMRMNLARIAHVDALAVYSYGDRAMRQECYRVLVDLDLPIMLLNDDMIEDMPDANFVRQENEDGAAHLAKAVIARGAKHILFVRPDHVWPAMNQRERGVRHATEGNAVVETIICSELTFADIVDSLEARLRRVPRVDAVMGGNDLFGIAALHAARRVGLEVPRDLQVTGFNGFDFRSFSVPLLSSVRSPAYDIGSEAADRLIARVTTGAFPPEGKVFAVTELAGETLRPLPVADL